LEKKLESRQIEDYFVAKTDMATKKCQNIFQIEIYPKDRVAEDDREHFLKIAKEEIAALHEGNFARYRLRPGEFLAWQKRKTQRPSNLF
jgi:hypothetical protein